MKVTIGQESHDIEVRRVTLVVPGPQSHQRIRYPGLVEIDLEMSCHHARLVEVLHPEVEQYFLKIFPDSELPERKSAGTGALHVIGRLDLSLKLQDLGVPFMWKYPEAGLHPVAQAPLADVIMDLRQRGRSESEVVAEELEVIDRRLNR